MRFLKQLRLHDKIRISFAGLTALILVNALVVGAVTYAVFGQMAHKDKVTAVLAEVGKVRLLVARYVDGLSPDVARQVFVGLEATRQLINTATVDMDQVQIGTLAPLLDDFKLNFQKYMVEANQKTTLQSRSLRLSQDLTRYLETVRLGKLNATDHRIFEQVQLQVMTLQGLGMSVQVNQNHSRALEPSWPLIRSTLRQLRDTSQQPRSSEAFQHQLYSIQHDADDYVDSLDNFTRLQQFNVATELQLDKISDTLEQQNQRINAHMDQLIREQIALAVALTGLIFVLTLLLALVSSRYLSREILRPIQALVDVTQRIGAGQLQARASVTVADEIGELAKSFNDMTQRLLDQNQALAVAQQGLEQKVQERTLQLAERSLLLRQIIDTAPAAIFIVDAQGHIVDANTGMADMFGLTQLELVGLDYLTLVAPLEVEMRRKTLMALLNEEITSVDIDRKYVRAGGKVFWGHLTCRLWRGMQGEKMGLVAVITDATERKRIEEKLQLAANVFTYAREGIVITDAQANIVDVNDTFTDITGYTRAEVLGQNPRLLKSDRQDDDFYRAMWQSLTSTDQWIGELWNRHKNGAVFAELLTISAVRDAEGELQNYVALFSDITPLKDHQQQLENIAHFDPLTQLPNRLLLADRLQQAMLQSQRHQSPMAVAYLDLDGFKAINDSHGHDVGDALLMALAHNMKNTLRAGDTLARIGGDEFVAVLAELSHYDDHEPMLQRLLLAASTPVQVQTRSGPLVLQVSASIGVTLYPQDDSDADLLMRHADQAMYAAKQSGKNRYRLFDLAHHEAIKAQMQGVAGVRQALDQHELVLFYQPKVNLSSARIIGAEALIRWQHPERGLLSPACFLPMIEDQPLSIDVGEWVIATALAQMQSWQAQGLQLPVSVNISARQLRQDGFVQRLAELLAAQPEVAPKQLQLEVLETSSIDDLGRVGTVMAECQKLGVSFALDDFGTGYSSLAYLRRLPAQTLKIDQSFVRDMLDDPNDLAIVDGVIGLAKAFGREVIAEGVETAAHGELLASLGCTLAQGYGIARPMPAAQLPGWTQQWHANARWTA